MLKGLLDLLFGGPSGGAMLTVAHRLALDVVEGVALGEEGCHEQKHQQSAAEVEEDPGIPVHG